MAKDVIGIDPGAGGGIAFYKNGIATAVKMPNGVKEIDNYIKTILEKCKNPIVFIEKLSTHRDTAEDFSEYLPRIEKIFDEEKDPKKIKEKCQIVFSEFIENQKKDIGGIQFSINKMLANYEQILTVLRLNNLQIVQVYPVSWQNHSGIKFENKNASKQERKNHYREVAQRTFPEVKVNLATADALCLIIFGCSKLHNDPNWVIQRIENAESKNNADLFS